MGARCTTPALVVFASLVAASCSDTPVTPDAGKAYTDSGLCGSTVQCGPGAICDPTTHMCTAKLTCATHADCGKSAFCGPSGQCAPSKTGSPCTTTDSCIPGETCVGGYCGCKGQSYSAQNVPPNVLVVLDRSSSMNDNISGGTKWAIAKKAIADLLTAQASKIRFGLALYPGTNESCSAGSDCGAGKVFVDPADNTAAQINSILTAAQTCSFGTPTAEMLTALLTYQGLKDTTRPNHILLITDGQSTCKDPVAVVTSLRGQAPEVKTFAVGFGSSVDATELNNVAQKGGTPRAGGPPYYYVATDAASLAGAFATIAGQVLSCTYTLSDKPKDLTQLYVYESKQPIARDTTHAGGWDYNAATNQITFYGAACQALQSGKVSDLVIVYGCPLVLE